MASGFPKLPGFAPTQPIEVDSFNQYDKKNLVFLEVYYVTIIFCFFWKQKQNNFKRVSASKQEYNRDYLSVRENYVSSNSSLIYSLFTSFQQKNIPP